MASKNKPTRQVSSLYAESFQGPIPPPSILEHYEQLQPGFAERILAMAERQGMHRMQLETTALTGQLKRSSRGQVFGFVLGLVGLIAGSFCIYSGHDTAGASLGGISLVSLVTVFVIGRSQQGKNLQKKDPDNH